MIKLHILYPLPQKNNSPLVLWIILSNNSIFQGFTLINFNYLDDIIFFENSREVQSSTEREMGFLKPRDKQDDDVTRIMYIKFENAFRHDHLWEI